MDYPPTGEGWSDQDFAAFFADFDKELLSLVGRLQSKLPFEICQSEVDKFIGKFAGGRDHPRWANMSLGGRYTFLNDLPAYNHSPAYSWIVPHGLTEAASKFWLPVIQSLPRFSFFRGTPRQQSKIREELLEAASDYLDARRYIIPDPKAANQAEEDVESPPETLLDELSKQEAVLLRYLWKAKKATFNALHKAVWKGKAVQDDAIRRAANRLKDKLELKPKWKHIQVAVTGKNVMLNRPGK